MIARELTNVLQEAEFEYISRNSVVTWNVLDYYQNQEENPSLNPLVGFKYIFPIINNNDDMYFNLNDIGLKVDKSRKDENIDVDQDENVS